MCGRFVASFSVEELLNEISEAAHAADLILPIVEGPQTVADDFNVAPTRLVPALRCEGSQIVIEAMRWGLIPSWAKEIPRGQALINARSETIHEKPSFRNLIPRHRCIVPMTGFYEWDRTDPRSKVPYFIPRRDGRLILSLAVWSRPSLLLGTASCAILTKDSHSDMREIHDRSPAQVLAQDAIQWMTNDEDPLGVLRASNPALAPYRVSSAVNSVRNVGRHLIDEVHVQEDSAGPLFE